MSVEAEIDKLKGLRLSPNSSPCRHVEFLSIRFELWEGHQWRCEINFGTMLCVVAKADSMSGAFEAARHDLMCRAIVVTEEECRDLDRRIVENREAMYSRWNQQYPNEKFNLILAIDRGIV